MELALLPAIRVKIGELEVNAVLASCGFCAIHEKVFKKITAKPNATKLKTDVKYIELDITIDDYPIKIEARVIPDLYVDMTLGNEFLRRMRSGLLFSARIFKWHFRSKVVITRLVESDESLRAISGGGDGRKYIDEDLYVKAVAVPSTSTAKPELSAEAVSSINPSTSNNNSKSRRKFQRRKSKKKNATSTNPTIEKNDGIHFTGFCQVLDQTVESKTTQKTSKNESNKYGTKVFISEKLLIDMRTGEQLAYYGVRWGRKSKNNFITGEILNHKSMLDCVFDALNYIFDKSLDRGIDDLHIILENQLVVKLMLDYQRCKSANLRYKPEGLCCSVDFENFNQACIGSEMFRSVKYEFVPLEDTTYREMVYLRELVHQFIMKTSVDDSKTENNQEN